MEGELSSESETILVEKELKVVGAGQVKEAVERLEPEQGKRLFERVQNKIREKWQRLRRPIYGTLVALVGAWVINGCARQLPELSVEEIVRHLRVPQAVAAEQAPLEQMKTAEEISSILKKPPLPAKDPYLEDSKKQSLFEIKEDMTQLKVTAEEKAIAKETEEIKREKIPENLAGVVSKDGKISISLDPEKKVAVVPQKGNIICGYSALFTGAKLVGVDLTGSVEDFLEKINFLELINQKPEEKIVYGGVEFTRRNIEAATQVRLKLLDGKPVSQEEYQAAMNAVVEYYQQVMESGGAATFCVDAKKLTHFGVVVDLKVENGKVIMMVTDGNLGQSANFPYIKEIGGKNLGGSYITYEFNSGNWAKLFEHFYPHCTIEIRPLTK